VIKKQISLALEAFCAAFTFYSIGSWLFNGRQSSDIESAIYTGIGVATGVVLGSIWRAKSTNLSSLSSGRADS